MKDDLFRDVVIQVATRYTSGLASEEVCAFGAIMLQVGLQLGLGHESFAQELLSSLPGWVIDSGEDLIGDIKGDIGEAKNA